MSFSNCNISSGDDEDEDISGSSNQSYSDKFDSDIEEELYRKIYYTPQVGKSSGTVSSQNNLVSSSCSKGDFASSSKDLDREKYSRPPKQNSRPTKRSSRVDHSNVDISEAETVVLSSGDSSDESVIVISSWDSSSSDLLTNMRRSENSDMETCGDNPPAKSSSKNKFSYGSSSDDNSVISEECQYSKHYIASDSELNENCARPTDLWHLDPEDLISFSSKSKRYYKKSLSVCRKCRETGHNAKNCATRNNLKCYLCGGNHVATRCENKVCGACFQKGHTRSQCPDDLNSVLCNLCKVPGHHSYRCPDIWRRYHLTTNPGSHLVQMTDKGKNKNVNYCYNCGLKGHLGFRCKYERRHTLSQPSSPFVISYEEPKLLPGSFTPRFEKKRHSLPFQRLKQKCLNKKFMHCPVTPQPWVKRNATNSLTSQLNFEKTPENSTMLKSDKVLSKKQSKRKNWRRKQKLKMKALKSSIQNESH